MKPTAGTQQYTATGSYSDGSTRAPLSATWDTLPGGIATIDANGLATAVSPGTTYITAASTADGSTITSGLPDAELCVECRNYPHIRQNVNPWKPDNIGNSTTKTIGGIGCYLTSWCMLLNSLGVSYTPRTLNNTLKDPQVNGFKVGSTPGEKIIVKESAIQALSQGHITNISDWSYGSYTSLSGAIRSELGSCNILIGYVRGNTWNADKDRWYFPEHYVLIVKDKNNQLYIHDPWLYNGDSTPSLDLLDKHYVLLGYRTITAN